MAGSKIPNELGNLRRSMVILTFGPGAIVDFRAEGAPVSAVVAGIEEWDRSFPPVGLANPQRIFEARLQKKLNVSGFRLPPVIDELAGTREGEPDRRSLVAVRFPTWLQCPNCNRISPYSRWQYDFGKAARYCPRCTQQSPGRRKVYVVPVRFVMACPAGHLDDFPWDWWVNHKENCTNRYGTLILEQRGAGLAGLILSCPICGRSTSMDGIFNSENLRGIRCSGKRPWLAAMDEDCVHQPRVLQRGASNLYFPVLESALSIPPWSDRLQAELGVYWDDLVKTDPADRTEYIRILARGNLKETLKNLNLTPESLTRIIEERLEDFHRDEMLNLKYEEYRHLIAGFDIGQDDDGDFEIRNVQVPDEISPYFKKIVRVVRLHEVIALRGFTRINPPGDENDNNIVPLSLNTTRWLPAIDVRGEGIFMEFNPTTLRRWAQQERIRLRAEAIQERWQREWNKRFEGRSTPLLTPRYLLVHTWAHALMRQLTLECGYSYASLRERIYVSDDSSDMAGVLIYTATSDSDGTLGGLQRQGEAARISPTVRAAVRDMEWCSSDPLCIEQVIAPPEHYSGSACHACCLAPETSCEQYNRFLDRAMLVGLPENREIGYFSGLLIEDDDGSNVAPGASR